MGVGEPVDVTSDGAQATPRKTGHNWLDIGVAFAAIFISLVSLYIAMENQKTQRDLLAASNWPFLREVRSNEYSDRLDVALGVSNGGVGPAKIKTFALLYDGQPMRSGLDLLRHCCGLGMTDADITRQLPHGYEFSMVDETVLRPGEDNVVLGVHREPTAPEIPQRLIANLHRVSFRACYCSVLNECWESDLRSTHTTPVAQCAAPAVRYVPNGN